MRGLKSRAKLPSSCYTPPAQPGRTLVFTSISSDPTFDPVKSHYKQDFFNGMAMNSIGEDTVGAEPEYYDPFLVHEEPPALPVLYEPEHSLDSASEYETEDEEVFYDLPEDKGSPIHDIAPHWPFREEEGEVTTISIIPVGRARLVDIVLSPSAKRRRSGTVSPRPEKRIAHSRDDSADSTVTVSPAMSTRSHSYDGERADSPLSRSTPATSVAGASEDDERSASSNTPSLYEKSEAEPPSFLNTDPSLTAPTIPRRSHNRALSKSFPKALVTANDTQENTGVYASPPATPEPEERPSTPLSRTRSRKSSKPSTTQSHSRRKSLANIFSVKQNLLR